MSIGSGSTWIYYVDESYDSELFFEAIRPQLTAWRKVQGTPEQKEAAARQTLQDIEQLEAEADEKLLRLLEPEKRFSRKHATFMEYFRLNKMRAWKVRKL